jgi:predicted esterase
MAEGFGLEESMLAPFTPGDATFDLGGRYVNTVRVQGHTGSSTVFALLGEDMLFSGDAIGSGSGVWIWGADGLASFQEGMASLKSYVESSYDETARAALRVYAGHAWQYGKFVEGGASCLDWQYIEDMSACINLVAEGAWFTEDSGLTYSPWENPISNLDCDFIYGTAAISATYSAACDYAGYTETGVRRSDYPWGAYLGPDDAVGGSGTVERFAYLDLFEEYSFEDAEAGAVKYYVYDPIKNGADPNGTYPVLLWLHGAGNALEGKNAITYAGAEPFASPEYQALMGGAYIVCPLANEYKNEDGSNAGTWMTKNEAGTTSLYSNALKGILDAVIAANPAIGKTFVIGTSAGGYGAWRFIIDWTDAVDASLVMAGAYVPTDAELDKLEAAGFPIWITHGYYDELVTYENFLKPVIGRLLTMPNVDVTLLKWVRNGDYSVATINFGIEMGQHCICVQIGQNLIYNDGTPYDPAHPDGVTGWIKSIAQAD